MAPIALTTDAAAAMTQASPVFSITNSATWPVCLTPEQIAAIYQRTVAAVKKACQQGRFVPAPFEVHPYRWRKCDVLRHLDRTPSSSLRAVGGQR